MSKEKLVLDILKHPSYKPSTASQLKNMLADVSSQELKEILLDLETRDIVVALPKGCYACPENLGWVAGRIQGNDKGFGFLIADDKTHPDVFIAAPNLHGAVNNDKVFVMLTKEKTERHSRKAADAQHLEGEVVKIVERANTRVVGIYDESTGKFGFVSAIDKRFTKDIFIPKKYTLNAKTGDRVVVLITNWPEDKNPEGQITEIFGREAEKNIDVLTVIKKFDFVENFPPDVLAEADKVAVIKKSDYKDRKDLRNKYLVTIDGEDTKDFDDAVSLEKIQGGGWILGVHIADVAHYVTANSKLDKEAWKRGTSIYFPDRVIPMLPQRLSNDVCSLNAGVDRLAMSCIMELDRHGSVKKYEICESVIKVKKRLCYEKINAALVDNEPGAVGELEELMPLLHNFKRVSKTLAEKRARRGAINFDFPETKIILDDNGQVAEIKKRVHGVAESMIEEMMICANETVAKEYFAKGAPFLYRVHEAPTADKLTDLNQSLTAWGYTLDCSGREIKPKDVQNLLDQVKGNPSEKLISTMLLRSMAHARYLPEALGHFGLAAKYYSHFTSPIRRYPDLAIHRVIKAYIKHGTLKDVAKANWLKDMYATAEQASSRERLAEEAEREAVKAKICQYMANQIGQSFTGIVSGVMGYGMYVELANTAEGLVHVTNMNDDYYVLNEKKMCFVGRNKGKEYALGNVVQIKVAKVDLDNNLIDFELCQQ